MNPQDIANLSQWLQQLMKDVTDTRTQLIDMRSENKQLMDEIKTISGRMDQKDSDILRLIDTLRSQLDVTRGEIASVKNAVESTKSHIDAKASDLKSAIHEVRNRVL